jgi:nitrilase
MHLFDIDLPGMEHLKESKAVVPGEDLVVAQAPFGLLGLSICYDLRFPELYRELTRRGARVLAVLRLHRAHGQGALGSAAPRSRHRESRLCRRPGPGRAPRRRASPHGQALIVDPCSILAQVPTARGWAVAELDFERQDRPGESGTAPPPPRLKDACRLL